MYNIHLLPASFGDSILIEYGVNTKKYILIDGGPFFNFETMIKSLKKVAPDLKTLELFVITHVDIDHIDGTVLLLNQKELPFTIKEVWFNGYNEMLHADDDLLGVIQGEYVSALLNQKKLPHNTNFNKKAVMVKDYNALPEIILEDGMKLTLLGPNRTGLDAMKAKWAEEVKVIGDEATVLKRLKDDTRYDDDIDDLLGELSIEDLQNAPVKGDKSEANGSSIAFIATYENKSCLFTGDLYTEFLIQGIDSILQKTGGDKLKVDAWKLAHHGSKKSNLETLMNKIETKQILVSSDGKRYHHPDKECIAKLIKHNGPDLNFFFNYKTIHNEMWEKKELQTKYQFSSTFPADVNEPGISISL